MRIFVESETSVARISRMTKEQAIKQLKGDRPIPVPLFGHITITYPLSVPYEMDATGVGSIGELMWLVSQAYLAIYETEEATMSRVAAYSDPNLINRGKSNGQYGVWGHSIGDLQIEGFDIKNGIITPLIGS